MIIHIREDIWKYIFAGHRIDRLIWPVAYSVAENILQTLMGLDINELEAPFIHQE